MNRKGDREKADRSSASEAGEASPGLARTIGRRHFLTGGASLIALSSTSLLLPKATSFAADLGSDPMLVPGSPARSYGERSTFESASRTAGESHSLTPLQDLHGIVTPSSLHFERHHNGVPAIDPARHRLVVHGLVKRPLIFTVKELERLPSTSRIAFLECSGNTWDGWREAQDVTVQDIYGLTSTSEWTGVKLSTLLEAVAVRREATWMLAEGSDAAGLDRSVPLADEVLHEAMICYGQNGEALRPEQGYPLRLLLPGFEGNTHIKWLRRLDVSDKPFMTREETSKYTDLLADGKARQFSMEMEAKSVIAFASGEMKLPGPVSTTSKAWRGPAAG